MIGGIQGMLSRMATAVGTAVVAAVSTARVAFAAGTESGLPPEYTEVLRLAQEKVSAATQPGASGNGVPVLNADFSGMLPWLGAALAAAILPYFAAKFLMRTIKRESITAQ